MDEVETKSGSSGNVASQLVAALTEEAELIDEGGFTLDPSKAREKLRAYQLVDAYAYVLLIVECAAIAKASSIDISCGRSTIAEFVGVPLSRAQLENVFTSVFLDTTQLGGQALAVARIQQLLGIAGNAALSLSPARIEIDNTDAEGRRHRMTMLSAGRYSCEPVGRDQPGRTRFVVSDDHDTDRDEREVALIRERCRYAKFPINLYGQAMSMGQRHALIGVRTDRIMLDGVQIGLAGIRSDRAGANLLLVTRGVLSETIPIDARSGFTAIVDVDLRKDLSQRGVLRGPAFDRVMAAVLEVEKTCI